MKKLIMVVTILCLMCIVCNISYATPVYIDSFTSFPAYPYNTAAYMQGGAYVGCGPTTGAMIFAYFQHVYGITGLLYNPVAGTNEGLATAWQLHNYMSTNAAGLGSVYNIKPGLENYAADRGFQVKVMAHAATDEDPATSWYNDYGPYGVAWTNDGNFWLHPGGVWNIDPNLFCDFIGAKLSSGIAIFLTVDSDNVEGGDHWIPCVGYDKATSRYYYYNTYDTTIHSAPIAYYGATPVAGDYAISFVRSIEFLKVRTPTFNPPAGTYSSPQNVALSCVTSGATIRYTTDGSSPSSTSTVYSSPISVSVTTTIKAKAFKSGLSASKVATATYTIIPSAVSFSDGYESGTFSAWSGTTVTTGETATVSSSIAHNGRYSAKFTSNGGGGTENAYVRKTFTATSDIYARGYFRVTQNGIAQDSDLFALITLRDPSTNDLAFAGWLRTAGVLHWGLAIRAGTGWKYAYSTSKPAINRWYSVEVHWKYGNPGVGELYVDGVKVCTVSSNTAAYGYAASANYGLTMITNCAATTAYVDCVVIKTTYIGPEPGTLFTSGFEGSFSGWSLGTLTTDETRSVTTSLKHHGSYSATFYSNGGGGTETSSVYRDVTASSELYLRGYFRVSQKGIVQVGDRVEMLSMGAAWAGWTQTSSGLRWYLGVSTSTGNVYAYSTSAPALNTWYRVELHWRKGTTDGFAELWVNGVKVCSLYSKNTSTYGNVNRVSVGLGAVNCGATRVYVDCVVASRCYIEPE